MPKPTDADVALQFADGTAIRAWSNFVWRDRFDDPLGAVSFTLRPTPTQLPDYLDRTQRGELVGIKMNGQAVHAPIITRRRFTSDGSGPRIDVEAKSVLAAAYEGCAALSLSLAVDAETPISSLILEAMAPYGFDTVISDTAGHVAALTGQNLNGRAPAVVLTGDDYKEKDWQVNPTESAYRYCQRICSRHGLVMGVNFEGSLLVGAPDYDQSPAYALHQCRAQQKGSNRLVNGYTIDETNNGQFSHCVVSGSSAPDRKRTTATTPFAGVRWDNYDPSTEEFGNVELTPLPAGLHAYRSTASSFKPKFAKDKTAKDADRAANWAARLLGGGAKNAWQMTTTLDGLVSVEGLMWAVDTVAAVYLEDFGLTEDLWIYATEKRVDPQQGQKTRLTLIPKGSLVLTTDP